MAFAPGSLGFEGGVLVMAVTGSRARVSPLAVLAVRPYRYLWTAQVASQLGDACAGIALIYLVSRLSHDPLAIGLVVFAMLLPAVLAGPWAGVLADRVPPRRLMIAADLWRLIVVGLMVPAARAQSLPALWSLVFLEGVGSAFFSPARAALVPRLVGRSNVSAAVGLSQATSAAVTVVGPGLGGLLVAVTSVEAVLAFDAATFLMSALLLLGARTPDREAAAASPARPPYFAALGEGFKALRERPALLAVLTVLGVFSMLCGILNTNQAAVLLQEFGLSATQYGSAQAGQGVGAVAGALLAPALIATAGGAGALFAGAGLTGLVMCVVSLVAVWLQAGIGAAVYLWAALLGVAVSLVSVTSQTLFMTLAPPQVLGRIAATMQAVTNLANVVGILAGGVLASAFGASTALAWAGGVAAVLSLIGLVSPVGRSVSREEQEARLVGARPVEAAATAALPSAPPPRQWLLVSDQAIYKALTSVDALRVLSALEVCPGGVREVAARLGRPEQEIRAQIGALLAVGLAEPVPIPEAPVAGPTAGGSAGASAGATAAGSAGGSATAAGAGEAVAGTPETRYRPATGAVRFTPEALGREGIQKVLELTVLPGLAELRRLGRRRGPAPGVGFNSQILRLTREEWATLSRELEDALNRLGDARTRKGPAPQTSEMPQAEDTYVFTVLTFRLRQD